MPGDLHADVSHLARGLRVLYGLGLIIGIAALVLLMLVVSLEVLTSSRPRSGVGLMLLAMAYSCWHVAREVRGYGPIPGLRWLVFFGAVVSVCVKAWSTIQDPTGRIFTVAVGLVGAAAIAGSRLIARRARAPQLDTE